MLKIFYTDVVSQFAEHLGCLWVFYYFPLCNTYICKIPSESLVPELIKPEEKQKIWWTLTDYDLNMTHNFIWSNQHKALILTESSYFLSTCLVTNFNFKI